MKVIILATGKTATLDDGYGARLIEQGKAVLAPVAEKTVTPAEQQETKEKKTGKG